MSCLPCGKVGAKEQFVVRYYKNIYETTGKQYYAYRLSSTQSFNFIEKKYFNDIFENQIKPNFINGAEYFAIQEFTGH